MSKYKNALKWDSDSKHSLRDFMSFTDLNLVIYIYSTFEPKPHPSYKHDILDIAQYFEFGQASRFGDYLFHLSFINASTKSDPLDEAIHNDDISKENLTATWVGPKRVRTYTPRLFKQNRFQEFCA